VRIGTKTDSKTESFAEFKSSFFSSQSDEALAELLWLHQSVTLFHLPSVVNNI